MQLQGDPHHDVPPTVATRKEEAADGQTAGVPVVGVLTALRGALTTGVLLVGALSEGAPAGNFQMPFMQQTLKRQLANLSQTGGRTTDGHGLTLMDTDIQELRQRMKPQIDAD